jgi:3-methyl-2-oxobutanoate hydroxymethyltransferase
VPRILDYNGREADRTVTVASIMAARGTRPPLVQVTAGTAEEAAAAEEAGIDMVVCMAGAVAAVREGSSRVFVTAAIDFDGAVTDDDLLADAFDALGAGADAVITARRFEAVERIATEDIPVMGHLGFVPKKSTLFGGVRAVGRSADEAVSLWQKFRRLEEAGAFAVECELIPANLMREINARTGLVTISLGSGADTDVMFLFSSDICGESPRTPRHARTYADLASMHAAIARERVRALSAFRSDVASGAFPSEDEVVIVDGNVIRGFVDHVDSGR